MPLGRLVLTCQQGFWDCNNWAKLGPSKSGNGGKTIMCLKLKAAAMTFTPC